MIYELSLNLPSLDYQIFEARPSRSFGLSLFWVSVAALAFATILSSLTALPRKVGLLVSLLIPSGMFVGLFTATFGVIDEVSVNLEHAYNLYHHGVFSMAADKVVDGTVEILFYLLHAPFSGSQRMLIAANYFIALTFAWLHLLVLWLWVRRKGWKFSLLFVSCYAVFAPIVIVSASGFGNILLSLFYLIALLLLFEKRYVASIAVCVFLPLIRPDGVLPAIANIVSVSLFWSLQQRWVGVKKVLTGAVLGIGGVVLSLYVYKVSYEAYFGVWPPTPVLFKRLSVELLASYFEPWLLLQNMAAWLYWPEHAAPVVSAIFLVTAILLSKGLAWREMPDSLRILLVQAVLLAPVFLIYNVGLATMLQFGWHTTPRYWLSFEIVLCLLVIHTAAELSRKISVGKGLMSKGLLPLLFVFLLLSGYSKISAPKQFSDRLENAYAGAVAERIVPDSFSIGTTEMNTFGLMVDRPVIDFWGYSNREIAKAKSINNRKVRYNPEVFRQELLGLFYPHWFTVVRDPKSGVALAGPDDGNAENAENLFSGKGIEKSLASYLHSSPTKMNLLGDMREVLRLYDSIIILDGVNQVVFLVKNTKTEQLIASLSREGFITKSKTRDYDWVTFQSYFEKEVTNHSR